MWPLLILVVILMIILYRSSIAEKITDKYAENLMQDPVFLGEVNKVNEEYAKGMKRVESAVSDIMHTEEYQRIQVAIDEVQDVRKGLVLHMYMKEMVDKYNVDWSTAAEAVRVGVASGKLKLDPAIADKEFRFGQHMFRVTPKEGVQ